jgi:hypothetical protein
VLLGDVLKSHEIKIKYLSSQKWFLLTFQMDLNFEDVQELDKELFEVTLEY